MQPVTRTLARRAALTSHIASKPCGNGQKRFLNVHEHQSMALMKSYGVPVPKGSVATTPADAEKIFAEFQKTGSGESADMVIKAQVLSGGRGLGTFSNGFHGGVHVVRAKEEAGRLASKMLGAQLITKQTGSTGRPCNSVYIMERLYLRRETYLSIMLDRSANGAVIIASPKGGTSIEDVAASSPEAITAVPVSNETGPTKEQLAKLAEFCQFSGKTAEQFKDCVANLWRMFKEKDATLVEVNPLAETPEGRVYVCDAKINFDDNAAFRQKEIFAMRDESQEDPREVAAAKYDLNYIGLDGNIGCMVNGAGLAMATMDIIKLHGGNPANFLDVGGGANEQQVTRAFEILNGDPKVVAILVNIFGGIMRCDVIAKGVVAAAGKVGLKKPVVVRMQGTNVEQAREIIDNCQYKIITCDDLDEAAKKVVKVVEIKKAAEEIALNVSFELPL